MSSITTEVDVVAARVKHDSNRRFRNLMAEKDAAPAPFICECADSTCYQAVWLTKAAYDRVEGVAAHGPRRLRQPTSQGRRPHPTATAVMEGRPPRTGVSFVDPHAKARRLEAFAHTDNSPSVTPFHPSPLPILATNRVPHFVPT